MSSPVCHYCGEEYEISTEMEEHYHDDPDLHNVCSGCLFDVISNDEELTPLEEYKQEGSA
jgi:hypothetical protein